MIIGFDFDGVADNKRIQQLIKKLVRERNEVWIITTRRENEFSKNILKPVLDMIGLTEHTIIYCDEKPKLEILQMINADIYIDNENKEFENILNHSTVIPLLYNA